ncbi:PEP/pyruvate-binding domain-containing protein [Pseudarthrobacter polychromogenes]|uniref:Phosphoenolpyruvate synthase n=1 Tax=Pseudarthrobacter polychromogenes TaxID=1676 RepID=A0ABQ1XPX2_9MICC|nr:PEP/pyruvate-binding domain-containing protein [Pseudarthrobacter polychromogenes]GGG99850.1 hypothetical protein GCM10011577_24240 [Pseudarthrobacter polychromogenes]
MTYIRDLSDVGPGDIAVAGGKAVGLGGLIRAGLPVPPGFVLTTAAYSEFVDANNLAAGIQELAALPPEAEPHAYQDASRRISALFATGTMPAGIAAELGAAYGRLGNGTPVAVRSSATAEDLASASFRGAAGNHPERPRHGGTVHGSDRLLGLALDGARHVLPRA